MGVYYQTWGNHEQFSGGTISTNQTERQARWFKIGNFCQIDVREHMRISKELTGDVRVRAEKISKMYYHCTFQIEEKNTIQNYTKARGSTLSAIKTLMYQPLPPDSWTCGMGLSY